MSRPSRFTPEQRARAVHLVAEARPNYPSEGTAMASVADPQQGSRCWPNRCSSARSSGCRSPSAYSPCPIPAEIMASYTSPLREHAGTCHDLARLLRVVTVALHPGSGHRPARLRPPRVDCLGAAELLPVDHAERLARPPPHAQLEIIDDSGPFTEDQPEQLTRLIGAFLAACRSDL